MNSGPKSKFNKKLLAIGFIIIVTVAVVVSWQFYRQSSNTTGNNAILPAPSLSLVGANGQQKILNLNDLIGLKSYTATGGYINDVNNADYVGNFTGVPFLTLLNLVGGITSNENVIVTSSDGYQMTFTYQQIQGQEINTLIQTLRPKSRPRSL